MCRRVAFSLFTLLLPVVCLGTDSPKEYGDRTTKDDVEGSWQLLSKDLERNNLTYILTYRSGKFIGRVNGKHHCNGTYTVNNERKPALLDETSVSEPDNNRTILEIYRIEGDTLFTASKISDWTRCRPKDFDEEAIRIYKWKRVRE